MRSLVAATLLPLCCAAAAADEPLEVDQAFQFSAHAVNVTQLEARWRIADGCYLYRDRIRFLVDGARLGTPRFSPAENHQDPFFGTAAIYRGSATVVLPISVTGDTRSVRLRAEFQGCDANRGICYPVSSSQVTIDLPPAK